jgi:hypothetical protein
MHRWLWTACLAAGLIGAAVVAAAGHVAALATVPVFLLPVLYIVQLLDLRILQSRPLPVLLAGLAIPFLLGAAIWLTLGTRVSSLALESDRQLLPVLQLAVLPVLTLLAMAAGPLLLLRLPQFDDALDAVTFGAGAGFAYTLGGQVVALAPLLAGISIAQADAGQWALLLSRHGFLHGLTNATSAALAVLAVWLHRHRRGRPHLSPVLSVPMILAVAELGIVLAALVGLVPRLILGVLLLGLLAALALVFLRIVMQAALLSGEGRRADSSDVPREGAVGGTPGSGALGAAAVVAMVIGPLAVSALAVPAGVARFAERPARPCTSYCGPARVAPIPASSVYHSSAFGYDVAFSQPWEANQQDGQSLVLLSGAQTLMVVGKPAGKTDQQLSQEALAALPDAQFQTITRLGPIRGAHIGAQKASGGMYSATFLPDAGTTIQVRIAVMAATRGEVSVTVLAWSPFDASAPNGIDNGSTIDDVLSQFRWPP